MKFIFSIFIPLLFLNSICFSQTNKQGKYNPNTFPYTIASISNFKSPDELISFFGSNNISTKPETDCEGGDLGNGYHIFPNTKNEVVLNIEGKYLLFNKPGSKWKMPYGITVGTPLSKVVKANGKDFFITGFDWDCDGFESGWNEGKLQQSKLSIQFSATHSEKNAYQNVTGSDKFATNDSNVLKIGLVVKEIYISLWE